MFASEAIQFYTNQTLEIVKKLKTNINQVQKSNSTGCTTLVENFSNVMVKQFDLKFNEQSSTISNLTKKIDEFKKQLEDAKQRRYDGLSFFGGMLFVGIIAILSVLEFIIGKNKQSLMLLTIIAFKNISYDDFILVLYKIIKKYTIPVLLLFS